MTGPLESMTTTDTRTYRCSNPPPSNGGMDILREIYFYHF